MSKSIGNLVPLRTALAAVGPDVLRWYLLDRPYADRLEWDARDLHRAETDYESVRRAVAAWLAPGGAGGGRARTAERLAEAVRHELLGGLRTDRAIDRIRAFARELDRAPSGHLARGERSAALAALRSVEDRTGLGLVGRP